jgi:hypothetical protein
MKATASGVVRALERFQAKWTPVRVKKTRQIKNLESRFHSIETEKALEGCHESVPPGRPSISQLIL